MPLRKQVCHLALKNRLAVARRKPATIVGRTQQVQFTESNYFTNKLHWTHWLLKRFAKNAFFWTFWCFLSWISAKLALIWSKMHLQLNSFPFLPPASHFTTLWLGYAQKSKFWTRKWPMSLGFSIFGIFFSPSSFLLFFSVSCSDWPSTGLACS